MALDYEILGDDMQASVFRLKAGEKIRSETGSMMYMDAGIEMETSTGGGIMQGIKRKFSGESFFITTFTGGRDGSEVAFAGPYPGKIIPIEISPQNTILCQRDAFLCSSEGVDISIAFTKRLGAGFFGGEGFILQKLSGRGLLMMHSGGTVIERELEPGEELRVDTGCLVAFTESVDYDIKFVGGLKTAFFGGEGLFFAYLKGPGKVWLQTLPFSRLADKIISAGGGSSGEVRRGDIGGNLIGNLLSGNR